MFSRGQILLQATILVFIAGALPGHGESGSSEWRISPRRARSQNPVAPDAASIARGAELYRQECESCHGATGKGDGPEARDLDTEVPDITGPKTWNQTDGELFWKITLGRRPMPSQRKLMTEEERWHLVNHARKLARRPGTAHPDAPDAPDAPDGGS